MPRDYNYNMYQVLSSVSNVSSTIETISVDWNMNSKMYSKYMDTVKITMPLLLNNTKFQYKFVLLK